MAVFIVKQSRVSPSPTVVLGKFENRKEAEAALTNFKKEHRIFSKFADYHVISENEKNELKRRQRKDELIGVRDLRKNLKSMT